MVYNRERQPHYQLRLFVQRTLSTFACRDCRVYFVLCALLWRFAFLCFVLCVVRYARRVPLARLFF